MTFQQIDSLLDGLNFTKLEFRNFKPSLGAGAGGLLAKRKTYQAIGFFDTSWGGYGGQDNDLHNKISNLHEHTDMSQYGVFFYKLPYVSGTRLEKIKSKMEHENHAFTSIPTESRDIKKSCFISVHEERVKATLAKKHAEAITWTGVKTSIHLAIKLHSYRVFNEPLYHLWNLSKIIYDNLSMWPHADVIASSQTAVYCLPSLAKRQSLHKIHIFLDGPLNNMKHIDLFLRCILRNGHIGYARAIETDKANIKDLAPNIRLDRPTIAVMESDFLIDHWRLFIQLVNTGNILRVFVVGTLTDDIEKKIKKVLKHQQINRRISVYTATEYRYGPKNTARHFTLFFLTYRLLSSLSILIGCAKFMLRPLTRLVKKIVLDSVK